jgi:mediator of RNA polymerase II transcription subunit 13
VTSCYEKLVKGIENSESCENVLVLAFNPFPPSQVSSILAFGRAHAAGCEMLNNSSTSAASCNIFWQLMPVTSIIADGSIVVPSQYHVMLLALGLYDKCPPSQVQLVPSKHGNDMHIPLAMKLSDAGDILNRRCPSFCLARYGAPKIPFRLTQTVPVALLDEDSLLHVSYSTSPDRRWVTAAWTDQWGELSNVEAYPLGRETSQSFVFEDTCREIGSRLCRLPPSYRYIGV